MLQLSTRQSLLSRALEDWNIVTAEQVSHTSRSSRSRTYLLPQVLEAPPHQPWLSEHGWELVPVLASHLTQHNEEAGPHLTACCQVEQQGDQEQIYLMDYLYFWPDTPGQPG